jgi:hypothetical protein
VELFSQETLHDVLTTLTINKSSKELGIRKRIMNFTTEWFAIVLHVREFPCSVMGAVAGGVP